MKPKLIALAACFISTLQTSGIAKEIAGIDVTQDVAYGHKFGLAMTFDVLTPKKPNGAAAVFMVSGGWVSRWAPPEKFIEDAMEKKDRNGWGMLLDRGFTVFMVRHGSSPMFKVPDAVEDVRRSIRFIRLRAEDYGIDPERIGVFGGSAGGHLALMLGTASDEGNADDKDKVNRVSNRVAAVVSYFPPTELEGYINDERFPALHFNKEKSPSVSPIHHVSKDDPPTLLLHGAKDTLVPLDHSTNILKSFQEAGVPAKLITFPDAEHGFDGEDEKTASTAMVEWFERHMNLNLKERFVGTWDVVGSRPDGASATSELTFTYEDGRLSATRISSQGESTTIDEVKVAGDRVILVKRSGRDTVVTIDTTENESGKLVGEWNVMAGGAEQLRGPWEATKRQPVDLAGKWLAVTGEGNEKHEATLEFAGSGAELSGVLIGEGGRTPLKELKLNHRSISFEASIGDSDTPTLFRIKADVQEDGSLKGTWDQMEEDKVAETGTWTAVKQQPIDITGSWDLELATGDQSLAYTLKVTADGDSLSGALVSPRSGEHKCKSVKFSEGHLTIHLVRDYNGTEVELKYDANLSDDGKLKGKFAAVGFEDQFSGTWTGTKK